MLEFILCPAFFGQNSPLIGFYPISSPQSLLFSATNFVGCSKSRESPCSLPTSTPSLPTARISACSKVHATRHGLLRFHAKSSLSSIVPSPSTPIFCGGREFHCGRERGLIRKFLRRSISKTAVPSSTERLNPSNRG